MQAHLEKMATVIQARVRGRQTRKKMKKGKKGKKGKAKGKGKGGKKVINFRIYQVRKWW